MGSKQSTLSKVVTHQMHLLAGCIFVLWSVGIVLLPAIGLQTQILNPTSGVARAVALLYILLHGVVFVFACTLLWSLLTRARRLGTVALWQAAIYAYVLLALATSLYLILGARL